MRRSIAVVVSVAAVLAALAPAAANFEPQGPLLFGYDVTLVQLDAPREVKQPDGQTRTYTQAYLIRLFVYLPGGYRETPEFYIGDRKFASFRKFPKGVYFLVFERLELDAMAGREIRYSLPSELGEVRSFSYAPQAQFQPRRFDLTTPVPLAQAIERDRVLPSQP